VTNFAANLGAHGNAPALITSSGIVTYEALERLVRDAAQAIGTTRRLVFLEAANTPAAIATYLGCLLAGHPVHLFGEQDEAKTARLLDLYRPNRVFASKEGVFRLVAQHDERIELHPQLRILLATSGSTGSPKLVKLSARNIESNAASIVEYLRLSNTERALTSLKFNYSYGMSIINSHLACGGALVLTEWSVLDPQFAQLLRQSRATSFAGVPYTFETLHKKGDRSFETPDLRYITQAGGKLAPDLVRHFAQLGEASGWRFYVMYGQTEAAPRMTYLPPEQAASYPGCIGVAVPGGRISVLDASGKEIQAADLPGELAYSGPNVMMGYAQSPEDLATDQTPARLLSGDVACRNSAGLYYIVGRSNRFVKPFGIRVNLDDVQAEVRKWAPSAACAGADEIILVALTHDEIPVDLEARMQTLVTLHKLPRFVFQVVQLDEIPRLSNGKTDFRTVVDLYEKTRARSEGGSSPGLADQARQVVATVFSTQFAHQMWSELQQLVGVGGHSWRGIAEIFSTVLSGHTIASNDTFTNLAGDSLSYVQASLAIEEYLGSLPPNWEHMTVAELEQRRSGATSI
jgi:acyl-CoA synthetase (AMP-forming)/AMP-acid ligase II